MPRETFSNLPDEKRDAITQAIQAVFLEKPRNKISVSDIVKRADIPRGSFYMYFDDLDDVFAYLLDDSMKAFEQEEFERISAQKISFFEYMEQALIKDIEFFLQYAHQKIIAKFMSDTQAYHVDYGRYLRRRHAFFNWFFQTIDSSELKGLEPERIMHLYYFIIQFKMQMIQAVFKNRLTKEAANREYLWFLQLIRIGLFENGQA